jgi:hypothetical protein
MSSKSSVTQTGGQSLIMMRSDELPETHRAAARIEQGGGEVMHIFGPRLMIGRVPEKIREGVAAAPTVRSLHADERVSRAPEPLSETEQLGLEAWNLRQSEGFVEAKRERPREGERWDGPDVIEPPDGPGMSHVGESDVMGAPEMAAEDMSPYLIGSVAVGLIIVEGPTAALQFTAEERAKVVAEVQEGLTWLGRREPRASVSWSYDIRTIRVNVQPDSSLTGYEPLEAHWRNPAMGQLGFSQNFQGVRDYVASIRNRLGTRWGYVAYFTKYPVNHFAYAAKPRLVMHYQNDGWGPDNIDRVFTHETGHIFGCPDEYTESGCNCNSVYGYLQEKNGNCQRCASPFVPCLMAANTWAMCRHTPVHLGWRDSDGDGTLDPVDPLASPQVDWNRLLRRFPGLRDTFGRHGLAPAQASADAPAHDSIPLFLLRRVLDTEQMRAVEQALAAEEDQYVEALSTKLSTIAREIKSSQQGSEEKAEPAAAASRRGSSKKSASKGRKSAPKGRRR